DEALDKFKVFKTEVELQQGSQIKRFRTDRGGEYMDTLYFRSVDIIHETTAPYTPQQNGISERKNKVQKEMVNFMLSYSGLSQGFWGEAMFYVIEPNVSVSINSIIESRDAIFDNNRFSSVPRPSQESLVNETEDIGCSIVPEEVTEEVVQQPEPELRKSKRNRTSKDFGPDFQLYLIEGTRNEVSNQHSDCFNVEDDPKTFDKAMKSHDVAFLKEAINDKMDSIMGNNTWVLADLPPADKCVYSKFDETGKGVIIFLYVDDMLIFGTEQVQVDLTKEFLSSKPDIAFIVGKLSRYTSNPSTQYWQAIQRVLKYLTKTMDYRLTYIGYPSVLEGYTDASWISNTEDKSSTSGLVFLLGGGGISWASKNQTCIIGLTMESKFVALATASKEAECAATLQRMVIAKCTIGSLDHVRVRHSLIRELITNGVISIEFVRSQQNLVDHFTKGLARDLVIKSAEGIRLKETAGPDSIGRLWVRLRLSLAKESSLQRLSNEIGEYEDEGRSLRCRSCTITAVSGSTGSTKLKFNNIRDLILGEDIRRKTSGGSKSKKRGQSKNRQDITCWNCNQKDHFQNQFLNPIASKDKEVHMAVRDYDDALVCCVENAVEDHIMDSDLLFHPTFCKEELEKFRLYTDKVRLVDDKSLDIAEVGDVVLKTSFDASWTLKDVSLVVARGNKRGSLYMVKIPCDGISGAIDGRGNATLWHQRLGRMSEKGMKILALKDRIRKIWEYKKTTDARASSYKCYAFTSVAQTYIYVSFSCNSLGGSRYYVTFINDSSMKKAAVENETNLRVKCLKSDNDREYISREFIEYYAKNGIRMLKTFSKTPQQNGV
ncbi:zinc finger, CCHC-type containing protein, partial [Tanacetum coccineum]